MVVKNAWLMFLSPCQWPENWSPSFTFYPETGRARGVCVCVCVFVCVCVCVCARVCACVRADYLSAWPQISTRRRAIACGLFSDASIYALHSGRQIQIRVYEYRMIIGRKIRKDVQLPRHLPQIPSGLPWNWNRTSAVRRHLNCVSRCKYE
jgi:hypothetical protein